MRCVVVPLQIEPLPAPTEKRIESNVVVAGGSANAAAVGQRQRLIADGFPVVAQAVQRWESIAWQKRLDRPWCCSAQQHVERRQPAGLIGQLPANAQPHLATQGETGSKPPPTPTEKRIESNVVVAGGSANAAAVGQRQRLIADGFPVVAQAVQRWESIAWQKRLDRQW